MSPLPNEKLHGEFAGNENRNFNTHRRIDQPNGANAVSRPLCTRDRTRVFSRVAKLHRTLRQKTFPYTDTVHFLEAEFHTEPVDESIESGFIIDLCRSDLCRSDL